MKYIFLVLVLTLLSPFSVVFAKNNCESYTVRCQTILYKSDNSQSGYLSTGSLCLTNSGGTVIEDMFVLFSGVPLWLTLNYNGETRQMSTKLQSGPFTMADVSISGNSKVQDKTEWSLLQEFRMPSGLEEGETFVSQAFLTCSMSEI